MDKKDIKLGITVAVDEKADGKTKSKGEVIGIYPKFFVIKKENGVKTSILWSDCKEHVNLVLQKKNDVYEKEFENIIQELSSE